MLLAGALAACLALLSACEFSFQWDFPTGSSQAPALPGDGLQVHFLDVGQADSTLLVCDGEAMLIDAGTNEQGQNVVRYLQDQGVETLRYVVGTHPHEDHIGGLDDVIAAFGVQDVLLPDKSHTSKTFEDMLDAIEAKNLEITIPEVGEEYTLGGATFTILSPQRNDYSDLNDYSIALRVEYGADSFLFTGDSGKIPNGEMLASGRTLRSTVYKVAHHGSAENNEEEFLAAIRPQYAVIQCGEGNSYGHPHAETLERLAALGTEVFRTDEDGTVVASTQGNGVTFTTQAGAA